MAGPETSRRGARLELVLGALNGLVGDYLARTDNGLATRFALIHDGAPLALDRAALARAFPNAGRRLVVLVHGLMGTEQVWRHPDGDDFGTRLARDLGMTPLYARYNTGRSIPESGAALADALTELTAAYPGPIDELVLLGHSMGGLVIRAACHVAHAADLPWLAHVRRAIYVGTPHRGAPLERAGRTALRWLAVVDDPYVRLAITLGDLRSAGVKDLGGPRLSLDDPRHPVPLLPGIAHHLVAGTVSAHPLLTLIFGDGIVPVGSATDGATVTTAPQLDRVAILSGVPHLTLARDPAVYARIHAWCAA